MRLTTLSIYVFYLCLVQVYTVQFLNEMNKFYREQSIQINLHENTVTCIWLSNTEYFCSVK